ncbi:MAG: response regulator [Promethearchaeota archaeon]
MVDNDESICKTLVLIFNKKGYEIITVNTGHEAIEKVKERFFNITLLDIKLPDIQGIDLIKPLKEIHPDMEVIIITAHASLETSISALNEGSSGYITKPLNMEEVFVKIKDVLEKQKLIAEKRRAEEEAKKAKEKYETLIKNIPEVIFSALPDETGSIIFVSNRWKDWTGYSPEDCYNDPEVWLKTIHPEDREQTLRGYTEAFKKKKEYILEYRIVHKETEKILHIREHGKPIKDEKGNIIRIDGVGINITKRKKAEEEVIKAKQKYLEAFNRENFYKELIVHEMNNILQNILSSTELCSMYLDNPKNLQQLEEFMNIIRDQILKGEKLISNARGLSKLEESKTSIRPINMYKVLKSSISFVKHAYQYNNIYIRIKPPNKKLFISANELLQDVFENILINAIKYNDNHSVECLIRITKMKKKGKKYAKIEFMDNGIGIIDSKKEKIFKGGYRKDNSISGMGLGLSLVKKIIETYNGQIWVEDKVKGNYSKGCNFVLLIPEVE